MSDTNEPKETSNAGVPSPEMDLVGLHVEKEDGGVSTHLEEGKVVHENADQQSVCVNAPLEGPSGSASVEIPKALDILDGEIQIASAENKNINAEPALGEEAGKVTEQLNITSSTIQEKEKNELADVDITSEEIELNITCRRQEKEENQLAVVEITKKEDDQLTGPPSSSVPTNPLESKDKGLDYTSTEVPSQHINDITVEPMEVENDILTKSANIETKTSEAEEIEGGNDDSQESLALVIDEKPSSPNEVNVDASATSMHVTNTEDKRSDTIIDVEVANKLSPIMQNEACEKKDTEQVKHDEDENKTNKPFEKENVAGQVKEDENEKSVEKLKDTEQVKQDENLALDKDVHCDSNLVNVIEIEDDIDEMKPQDEDPDVEITETRSASYIPVIEIDDDDEYEDQQTVRAAQKDTTNAEKENQNSTITQPPGAKENSAVDSNEDTQTKDLSQAETVTEKPELLLEPSLRPEPKESKSDPEESGFEDKSDEIFYDQECINHDCPHNHKQFFLAPQFALSHFKVKKRRTQKQYVCSECYDNALDVYEEYCCLLKIKQPLLLKNIAVQGPEFVEITDSSDEEDEPVKAPQIQATKGSFSKVDLDLIESELENSIKNVLESLEIQNQLTWSKTILSTRIQRLEEESNLNDDLLRSLQKKADQMYSSLYQCPKIRLRQFQPLDLNTGLPYTSPEITSCPPVGEISRPVIEINQIYYAVKNKAIASWVPCKVVEQVESNGILGGFSKVPHYKVKFLKLQYQMVKTVSAKHLAYYDPPKYRLPIGSRVIAYFDATSLSRGKEKMMIQSAFYPGIIAEPLKPNNKYRYLIFYDDGYTQYVSHKDVRLVCNVSDHVWEDVHPASREFIQKYLTQYSINRPMVQTQKGQSMTTESNGKWIYARVVDIDCSLIQMQFEGPKSHTEWIYRGSLRLGPVFKEYQKTLQKDTLPLPRLARRTEPFIRYTADEEATTAQQQQQRQQQAQERDRASTNEPRAVAKKSVSRLSSDSTSGTANTLSQTPSVPTVRHLNNSTIYLEDENKPKGKVVYYTAKRDLPPLTYRPHKCSSSCLFKIPHNLSAYSPLSKPLLSGWERPILRLKNKKIVAYRGPCGKIMRNMEEVRRYLRATDNILNVDNFDFHHETSCLAEYVIESAIIQKRDISGGQEKMAIPLVNYYDNTLPPECKYAAQRIPTDGVNINLDPEFLVGCDCEDDCSDKSQCSCWQLTYAGAKYGNPNTPMEEIGYQYKRLYEHVPTGIYECNSRCKCKSNCLNRVAQQPLAMKLQVFKTSNRGWGLRCINDVPRGSFVCIYAGHLLTEAKANEGGLDAGDEYFAELDYIEVAEQIKEGYESDVEPPEVEEEEDSYAPDPEDDDEFTPSKSFLTRAKNKAQKLTRSGSSNNTDEDSQERQVINFNPNADMNEDSGRESSIRTLFGKDEACYVMDAKITGNLGRYFNHSCSPNLFVQNVFVDTHDLRFPWVAFFSSTNIRAGTELTWNYNYEVGVVPGKVLYCQCGAPNCRLRLL